LSSPAGFLDVVYLGVFIILSSALDRRFDSHGYAASTLMEEQGHAILHFHSLLHIFTQRFIVVLDGQPIAPSYVVDRMLGEFAAAIVVFNKAILESLEDSQDGTTLSRITDIVTYIIKQTYPAVFPYFSDCVRRGHKHFLWTGPNLHIFQHSEGCDSIMPLLTLGELIDLPGHQIYQGTSATNTSFSIPTPISSTSTEQQPVQEDSSDLEVEHPRKRRK
jgi:hypothetical protein